MTKPKHTPGPWMAVTFGPNQERFRVTALSLDFGNESEVCHVLKSNPNAEANAHLIAAAPELLQALRQAVEYFEANGGEKAYTELAKMKARIARAEGKR